MQVGIYKNYLVKWSLQTFWDKQKIFFVKLMRIFELRPDFRGTVAPPWFRKFPTPTHAGIKTGEPPHGGWLTRWVGWMRLFTTDNVHYRLPAWISAWDTLCYR